MFNSNIDSNPLKHAEKPSQTKQLLTPIDKARLAPNSLRTAIDAHCYQCIGEDADPYWQKSVGQCHITKCALWPHRPYQHHAEKEKSQ